MSEDGNAWLERLRIGDKVYIGNRFARHKPPLCVGVVHGFRAQSVEVRANGINKLRPFYFQKHTGYLAEGPENNEVIGSLCILPYTNEGEFAFRQRKEKSEIVSLLRRVEWDDLPLDVLDSICAILRENGMEL